MVLFAWLMLHLGGRNESPQLPRQAKVAEAEELIGNAGIMGKGMGRGGMDSQMVSLVWHDSSCQFPFLRFLRYGLMTDALSSSKNIELVCENNH